MLHSQNHVPHETAPAGNGCDTDKIQHAREAPSFEKSCDTAYPEKSLLIPYKINRLIGIPQAAVTRDFDKTGALRACRKI